MSSLDRKTGPLLEIACFNAASGVNAAKGGANRIELCVDYSSGGLTPDPTVLIELKNQVSIPVYTMLRPHSNSFIYDEPDFIAMKSDLVALDHCGADGFVFGILKNTDPDDISKPRIDIEKNTELVQIAGKKPCTFHRAFDCIPEENWGTALIDIATCGFASILTSGGPSGDTAIQCIDKLALLFETLESVRSRLPEGIRAPEIIVGGGVRASNILLLAESVPHAAVYHSSALTTVEPERRQWRWLNFVAFWIADSLNVNTWMISSSMIVDGLSWWQSWLCVWIGYSIAAIFVCLLGRIGAIYRIPFAVTNRASFGIWGSFWPILNRAAMAVIWYGVQTYLGGECVTLMIQAIWPSYANLPNTMPASAGVTTQQFVSFFLFWIGSLPALWFPIYKIRHLFTVKAYFSPACAIAFFGWAIARAHGLGPIMTQSNTAHGRALAWVFVKSIMNCIANFAALVINNPDFARYAREPKDALLPQLITIPVGFAITSFIGIVVSSSSSVIFNQSVWNPLTLLGMFLEDASSAERFGIFVIASGFALAQLGTNIAANSVSAGTNLTALLPRFCTIRRGGYFCAAVGLAMCPWTLVASSSKFTIYLSAYSVFLSAIAGVMASDYYLVRKGYLDIQELYSARKDGHYYGTLGILWHGYAAYLCGILVNIVGFAGAIGVNVPIGAVYIYDINYFSGFIVSGDMYWALTTLVPIPGTSKTWNEIPYEVNPEPDVQKKVEDV